jgi:hypothetical protein
LLQPLTGGAPKAFIKTNPDEVFNVSQFADGKKQQSYAAD